MSQKEKEILKNISALPGPLQDKFLNMAQGAAMAMDTLAEEKGDAAGGSSGVEQRGSE